MKNFWSTPSFHKQQTALQSNFAATKECRSQSKCDAIRTQNLQNNEIMEIITSSRVF